MYGQLPLIMQSECCMAAGLVQRSYLYERLLQHMQNIMLPHIVQQQRQRRRQRMLELRKQLLRQVCDILLRFMQRQQQKFLIIKTHNHGKEKAPFPPVAVQKGRQGGIANTGYRHT